MMGGKGGSWEMSYSDNGRRCKCQKKTDESDVGLAGKKHSPLVVAQIVSSLV